MGLFLKNSEVKDEFKAKGLKEAGEVLDIMRLPKNDQYGYNRYMDSLSLKASEIFTLQTEATFKAKDERTLEIAINLLKIGMSIDQIVQVTGLNITQLEKLQSTK